MPHQAPTDPVEAAKINFDVDLHDPKAVRAKMITLQANTPKLLELLNLWDAHERNEKSN